ncbi:MAG: sodium:solute symporter family transporter [Pseudoxanthomonas sp.]
MTLLDWLIGCTLFLAVLIVGMLRRRKPASLAERFTADRQLPWYLLGGSMAATAFSADTPLLVAGAVYQDGLAGNWFWWATAPGALATLYFFARLWRRSGVITEMEVFELRYGHRATARRFRALKALIDGIVVNALVIASIGFAFGLLIRAFAERLGPTALSFSWSTGVAMAMLVVIGMHTILAGFRGVVRTEVLAFLVAISASCLVVWFALPMLPHGLDDVRQAAGNRSAQPVFDVLPDSFTTFALVLGLGWLHSAPGNGMLVQRMVAARDERDAARIVLTYTVLHYLIRPWPWYLVGGIALVIFPWLDTPELAFPMVAMAHLPGGAAGLLVAALALAAGGSINSRLNFGASLAVNDILPLLLTSMDDRTRLRIERATIGFIVLSAMAMVGIGVISSIRGFYQFFIVLSAGTAFAAIARWYWWRMTIRSEIGALIGALIGATLMAAIGDVADPDAFALMLGVNLVFGALIACVLADWKARVPDEAALRFAARVRPGGPGWRPVPNGDGRLRRNTVRWTIHVAALFAAIAAVAAVLGGPRP